MLRLGNANAIVIQGLIAPKGLDCLKALISWKFEKEPEGEGEGEGGKTLVLRAPLVAIGAQKVEQLDKFRVIKCSMCVKIPKKDCCEF